MASSGKIVLSYGDYLLRQSEIDILSKDSWLNDTLIGFYFEYLSNCSWSQQNFKFFGPEVTQCMKLCPIEEISILLGDVDTKTVELAMWPVNDADNPSQYSGGTHWSLLVYSRSENVFWHFDSSFNHNSAQAGKLVAILKPSFSSNARFEEYGECQSQMNSYDCGMHVICNAEAISKYAATCHKVLGTPTASPIVARIKRQELVALIEQLSANSNSKV